jgi:hypothetical protein
VSAEETQEKSDDHRSEQSDHRSEQNASWRDQYWTVFPVVAAIVAFLGLNWWLSLPICFLLAYVASLIANRKRDHKVWMANVAVICGSVLVGFLIGHVSRAQITRYVDVPNIGIEQTNADAQTWSDYQTGSGTSGPEVPADERVLVSCRIQGRAVFAGDAWWYRIPRLRGIADITHRLHSSSCRGDPITHQKSYMTC